MKNVIPAVIVGVMVLALATSSLAEAKPGIITVQITVKDASGKNVAGASCNVIGLDAAGNPLTSLPADLTNNGGKTRADIPESPTGVAITDVVVDCGISGSNTEPVSPRGPTKVLVQP